MSDDLFEEYLELYKNTVYNLCLAFVKNSYDAEDLTQETFLSAYRSFAAFDRRNPKSWFCTIAANKCRDFLKSPARRTRLVDTHDLTFIQDPALSVADAAETREENDRTRRLCNRLKEPYRSVSIAHYCDDETLTEISIRMRKKRKTVATQLYRARALLKILLQEELL